jgi:hypothetical protein
VQSDRAKASDVLRAAAQLIKAGGDPATIAMLLEQIAQRFEKAGQ